MTDPILPLRTPPEGVTIAIPNWSHEYLLPRSVSSALRAVRELRAHGVAADTLVVDDMSRDGSLTLLRQFEALYFEEGLKVLALPRNGGLPAKTREQALNHATYRYIVFMDADNEMVPENLYHFYRAIRNTGAAMVYGNLIHINAHGEAAKLVSNESFQSRIMVQNYIDAFALADRAQLLDAGGHLDTRDMIAREDWELYLHLAASGRRIVFVPLVMGFYHDIPGSITKATTDAAIHSAQYRLVQRMYNQLNIRAKMPSNTRHLRYHPDVGYL
jgi:succinoglycan biosynthesis protein ExoO